MTDEDLKWFELWKEARKLSDVAIISLEDQLRIDQSNMDVRVQLFSHYSTLVGNKLKHQNAEQKLFEHVLWLIENKPSIRGSLAHWLSVSSNRFRPKRFATLREAWLEQVSIAPLDGTILGNAASFIVWNDFETAVDLFERAYKLQPTAGWLRTFVIHCNSELWHSPSIYLDKIRERIIDVGLRSLESEPGGAPFLTCEFVSDAALSLGRLEIVRYCSEILCDWGHPGCEQMANAYLGLVALRENDRSLAIQLMLKMKRGYQPQPIVFRLARELFDLGERESIVQLITSFKGKVKASVRSRWLKQMASNEAPDFEYCSC